MRVLVVEDEDDICDSLREVLEMFGHIPMVAKTVEKALDILCTDGPTDVVLLDLILKSGESTELIKKAREKLDGLAPRIILVSASNRAKEVAESNGVEFLPKPFDIETLHAMIDNRGKEVCSTA